MAQGALAWEPCRDCHSHRLPDHCRSAAWRYHLWAVNAARGRAWKPNSSRTIGSQQQRLSGLVPQGDPAPGRCPFDNLGTMSNVEGWR